MNETLSKTRESPLIKVSRIEMDEASYQSKIQRYKSTDPLLDTQDVVRRMETMHGVLEDVERATDGRFRRDSLARAKRVLDLGMGRGAVGGVIRELNPRVDITGVDDQHYYGDVLYDSYNHRIIGDVSYGRTWDFLVAEEEAFDFVIAVGLPPEILESIAVNTLLPKVMTPDATALLITDFFPDQRLMKGFEHFKGRVIIDENIYIK